MEKRCSKCKALKPLEAFYEQAAGKHGRTSRCIECVSEIHRCYRERTTPLSVKEARARKQSLFTAGLKECTVCGEVKPFGEFFKKANGRPTSECKACKTRAHRDWKEKNKQHLFEYVRAYTSDPEIAERKRKARQTRRAESPRWTMQITLAHGLRRIPTENPATVDDLMQKWNEQSGCCALTGIKMTWAKGTVLPTSLSLDRINPNGGYSADNVRLVCHAINAFRGRMTDAEMFQMAHALIARADADNPRPTWRPHVVHSEAA